MNDGETLKILVKKDQRQAKEIAALINVSENTMLNLYKKRVISNEYKERFREIGIDIDAQKESVVKEPEIQYITQKHVKHQDDEMVHPISIHADEGAYLRQFIEHSERPVKEWAERLGLTRTNIYQLYGRRRLDDKYIKRLKKEGLNLRQSGTMPPKEAHILQNKQIQLQALFMRFTSESQKAQSQLLSDIEKLL